MLKHWTATPELQAQQPLHKGIVGEGGAEVVGMAVDGKVGEAGHIAGTVEEDVDSTEAVARFDTEGHFDTVEGHFDTAAGRFDIAEAGRTSAGRHPKEV